MTSKSFIKLWEKYSPNILKYLLGRYSPHDAEEIIQEVALFAWTHHKETVFANEQLFSLWLFRIAKHKIREYYRNHANAKTVPLETEVLDQPSIIQYAQKTKLAMLREIFDKLNEKDRLLLYRKDILGLSYNEISELTGTSPSALSTAHQRAIEKANKIIEKFEK